MSHVDDVARAWRALVLAAEPTLMGGRDGTPSAPAERQHVYRRLVRNNLAAVVNRACPHARRLAGEDVFARFVTRFLDEQPPTTRLVRDIPQQFTAWLSALSPVEWPHPSFAELCHFEALEIEVTLAETARQRGEVISGELDEAAVVVVDPAARLAVYAHPVHRVTRATATWPAASASPVIVLCFQQADGLVVEALSPAVARVLLQSVDATPLGAALEAVEREAEAAGVGFDRGRVRADLVDLYLRGAVAGFRRP